jgi:anti-sigma factor RsiW
MQDAASGNHAAAAWVEGRMDAVQRQEFEAHLADCTDCQAQVAALRAAQTQRRPVLVVPTKLEVEAAPQASGNTKHRVLIVIAALVTLVIGFALGWSVWQMTNR